MSKAPAGSLHAISVTDAIRAAAGRTPRRVAVVEGDCTLTYEALFDAAQRPQPGAVAQWIAAMRADVGDDENRPAAAGLSHRELALRALDRIVEHGAFDRDGTIACALPFPSPGAYVAATISLWLGSTLQVIPPGDLDRLAEGLAQGRFQTCFLGAAELAALDARRAPLPSPSPEFLLAVCEFASAPDARHRLSQWLGAHRVTT